MFNRASRGFVPMDAARSYIAATKRILADVPESERPACGFELGHLTTHRGERRFCWHTAADRLPCSATANAIDMDLRRFTNASIFGRIYLCFIGYASLSEGPMYEVKQRTRTHRS